MNRRDFLTASAAAVAFMPSMPTSALAVTPFENPVLEVFKMLPAQPGGDGFDFPATTGINGRLQRSVWPENPDLYWDPEGEDYFRIFGFHPSRINRSGTQTDVSLWQLDPSSFDRGATQQSLESNGWQVVDDALQILHYSGNEDDRDELAGSLNLLGNRMHDGEWDWIALPDSTSAIVGSQENRVRLVADRVQNRINLTSMYDQFRPLRPVLRMDSYLVSLLPPQQLPVATTHQVFLSRSWDGDVPIIQSFGLQLESDTYVQSMIDTVQDRLETQSSGLLELPYARFLEIVKIAEHESAIRFDLVDSSGEWDVFRALATDDLLMLPPTE